MIAICLTNGFKLLFSVAGDFSLRNWLASQSVLMTDPFSEDAHGFAASGIDLGLAPDEGFGKAKGMEDVDNLVEFCLRNHDIS